MARLVSWTKLETAYGPATGLDKTIAKLGSRSGDLRAQALLELEGCIAHQGTIYSASAPAIPLLLALVANPETRERGSIVRLLGKIAWGRGDKASERAVAAALTRADVTALLDDAEAVVRRESASLIGALIANGNADLADQIITRLATEKEPAVLLAIAPVPAKFGRPSKTWRVACEALLAKPATRWIGAVALGSSTPVPTAAADVLVEMLRDPEPYVPIWATWPWGTGDVTADVAALLGRLKKRAPIEQMLAIVERTGSPAVVRGVLAASKSDAVLRRILDCDLARQRGAATAIHQAGIYTDWHALRAKLGLPSVLVVDRVVKLDGKRAPLWELARTRFKKKRTATELFAELGLEPQDEATAILELLDGVHRTSYAYDGAVALDAAWDACVARMSTKDVPALVARLHEGHGHQAEVLSAIVTLTGALDPALDRYLPTHFVSTLHGQLPPARVEAIVFETLCAKARELGEPEPGHWGIGFARPAETAARFLGHCPTKRLAQLVLALGGMSGIWMDVEAEVAKHRSKIVTTTLAEFRKRTRGVGSYAKMKQRFAEWIAATGL